MVELDAGHELDEEQAWKPKECSTDMKGTDKQHEQVETTKCDVATTQDIPTLYPEADQHTTERNAEVQLLFKRLQTLAQKQDEQLGTLNLPVVSRDDCISFAERDSAVSSIRSMQKFYNFGSDTLAEAVTYLDIFLSKVKHHPSASQLCSLHRFVWKPTDLKRMEKIMLDKLSWCLFPSVSCLSFLKIIFDMLCLVKCNVDRYFFRDVIERSEFYLNYSRCAQYRPCTLAVAVFRECLKEQGLSGVLTSYTMLHIQAACQISDSELLDCQCAISRQLDLYNTHPATHPPCLPLPRLTPRPNLVTKPSCYGTTDLPTIEEVPWSRELREALAIQNVQPYRCKLVPSYNCCAVQPVSSYDIVPRSAPQRCVLVEKSFSNKICSVYEKY